MKQARLNGKAKGILFRWETALVVFLIAEILIFGLINPRMLKVSVLLGSVNDFVFTCIIALFVTFVIVTGGMDISGGSIVGLTSMVLGLLWQDVGLNIWVAMFLSLFAGVLCGALNGVIVAYAGVQAMVVTLGGSFLYAGLAIVLGLLSVSSAFEGIAGYPDAFVEIANGEILGIPNPFIIFVVLTVIAYFLLQRTKYGRKVYLVGVSPNAARYTGINHKRIIMSTYVLSGLAGSIAGVLLTSYLGSSRSDLGSNLTMPIITSVVLGGTSITGGRGTVIGTALASLVVGILRFGLQMARVPAQYLDIPVGILLVVVVAVRALSGSGAFSTLRNKFSKASKA